MKLFNTVKNLGKAFMESMEGSIIDDETRAYIVSELNDISDSLVRVHTLDLFGEGVKAKLNKSKHTKLEKELRVIMSMVSV